MKHYEVFVLGEHGSRTLCAEDSLRPALARALTAWSEIKLNPVDEIVGKLSVVAVDEWKGDVPVREHAHFFVEGQPV